MTRPGFITMLDSNLKPTTGFNNGRILSFKERSTVSEVINDKVILISKDRRIEQCDLLNGRITTLGKIPIPKGHKIVFTESSFILNNRLYFIVRILKNERGYSSAVIRFNNELSAIDTFFGEDGFLFYPPTTTLRFSDRNLYSTKIIETTDYFEAAIFRYNEEGNLDNSFNETGKLSVGKFQKRTFDRVLFSGFTRPAIKVINGYLYTAVNSRLKYEYTALAELYSFQLDNGQIQLDLRTEVEFIDNNEVVNSGINFDANDNYIVTNHALKRYPYAQITGLTLLDKYGDYIEDFGDNGNLVIPISAIDSTASTYGTKDYLLLNDKIFLCGYTFYDRNTPTLNTPFVLRIGASGVENIYFKNELNRHAYPERILRYNDSFLLVGYSQ